MKKDRMNYLMEVVFKHPGDVEEYKEDVFIPTEIFIEAIRKFADRLLVGLDGTDSSIFELFGYYLNCFDSFVDNEDFLDICRELYKDSKYEDEDYELFSDNYDLMHNLGDYSDEE